MKISRCDFIFGCVHRRIRKQRNHDVMHEPGGYQAAPQVQYFQDGQSFWQAQAALTRIFQFKKAAALGIASYPAIRDGDRISLRAAYALIEGAIRGIQAR